MKRLPVVVCLLLLGWLAWSAWTTGGNPAVYRATAQEQQPIHYQLETLKWEVVGGSFDLPSAPPGLSGSSPDGAYHLEMKTYSTNPVAVTASGCCCNFLPCIEK